jgi:hypothetical protein
MLLQNNAEIQVKRQEIEVHKSENSILHNIRLSSAYNFETQTAFYGVVISLPLNIFDLRKKRIEYLEKELEKLIHEKETELEKLYYLWHDYQDQLFVKRLENQKKKEDLNRKRTLLEYNKIDLWEAEEAKIEYQFSLYEVSKLEKNLQKIESQIKRMVGLK